MKVKQLPDITLYTNRELDNLANHELNAHIRQILEFYDEITHSILLPDNKVVKVNVDNTKVTITNTSSTDLCNLQVAYLNMIQSEMVSRYLITGI